MKVNIRFYAKGQPFKHWLYNRRLSVIGFGGIGLSILFFHPALLAAEVLVEPVQACVISRDAPLNDAVRGQIAECLGWQSNPDFQLCQGNYSPLSVEPLRDEEEVQILAKEVSFYREGRSKLTGNVEVHQTGRIVNAQTAYVYRDAKSNQVTKIELLGDVRYLEPGRLMIARKVTINPQDKSGQAQDVLYRFNSERHAAVLPAWGRASYIERFANKDYLLQRATYTTCAPQDKSWEIKADSITLDQAKATGVARHAKLLLHDVPILYTPYLSFPTSKERKSGFLMPTIGSSSVGGFDFSMPYYWNIAPNYDATFIPEAFSRRGFMMGGQFRYLTEHSIGLFNGQFLPNDKAYKSFLQDNEAEFPQLEGASTNRWSFQIEDITKFYPNLQMHIDVQQVSDNYFLQDFSNNLSVLTERQLLRQGDLTYNTDHWLMRGSLQSYQTLQLINQTPVSDIYERLPQLMAQGNYDDLPFNGNFSVLGQFDYFHWPNKFLARPEGQRYYLNPALSLPQIKPWGYFTPRIELVQNLYEVTRFSNLPNAQFSRTIPRYSLDTGLYFDRSTQLMKQAFTQTLEPRLYYLNVPFETQTAIPVYDSAYMIFNADQLFRSNRFSGFDRIGDTNQLAYALSTRWIAEQSGMEKASLMVGQIRYFSDRLVPLCQNPDGYCQDNPFTLGFLSPTAKSSPIASRAVYRFNTAWALTGDYVWDPATSSTNNGHVDFHYQPAMNQILSFGYTYLVNGDITQVATSPIQENPLHQATIAYAWPFNERWSSLGGYSYNISKGYDMMTFAGIQYDNCCWAIRLVGGRAFQNLNSQLEPQYNTNVYLQFLLKGLGSVGNNDPTSTVTTYLPGYVDSFRR